MHKVHLRTVVAIGHLRNLLRLRRQALGNQRHSLVSDSALGEPITFVFSALNKCSEALSQILARHSTGVTSEGSSVSRSCASSSNL